MSPVERAARALYQLRDGPSPEMLAQMSAQEVAQARAYADTQWPEYAADVLAVLTAIREPSGKMVDAGCRVGQSASNGMTETRERFRAMINAALVEQSK